MVERLTYRRHTRYNTKSNKQRILRTPGGKLVYHHVKKKCQGPKCGDCGKAIIGVPQLRPIEYRRLKKRERRVNRAYGGSRCAGCTRTRVIRAFLIEEQKCVKQVLAEKMSAAKPEAEAKSKKGKKLEGCSRDPNRHLCPSNISAMVRIFSTAAVVLAFSSSAFGVTEEEIQVAAACRRTCETFREESSSHPACGKWLRTLPRPKVGRSCTEAFDTMFKTTCLNMCNGQEVTVDVHGACDHQRKEMPKPVVGRACNEGYEGGYETAKALFSDEAAEEREAAKREKEAAERAEMEAAHAAAEAEAAVEEKNPAAEEQVEQQQQPPAEEEGGLRGAVEEVVEEVRKVIATLPVTVDESDINLVIYEGQQAAEAVDAFCKKHMASAGTACMDQLLPHVEKKISDKL